MRIDVFLKCYARRFCSLLRYFCGLSHPLEAFAVYDGTPREDHDRFGVKTSGCGETFSQAPRKLTRSSNRQWRFGKHERIQSEISTRLGQHRNTLSAGE